MKLSNVLSAFLYFLGFLFTFTLPIHPVMNTTFLLAIVDTISGVMASKKEGQKITSHKFKRKLILLVCYLVGIMCAFLMEKYMVQDTPLVKALAAMIAINEGKSISENFYRLTGVDLWKLFIDKLQGPTIKNDEK